MIRDNKKFDIRSQIIARIGLCLGTLCCLVFMISSWGAEQDRLSVQETLGGIFVGGVHGIAVAEAANPAAKPILYQLLGKPQMKEHRGRIYLLFSYIGDKEDAATIEKRVKAGHVDFSEMDKIFSVLSTMQSRGVSEAGTILERMIEPEYWRKTKFIVLTNFAHGVTNELAIRALVAYARSGKSDWKIKVESLKEKARNPTIRTELEWRLDPIRITQHIQEAHALKIPPISPELRAILPQMFNGDMDNPGAATKINLPRQPDEAEDNPPPEPTVVKALASQELAPLKIEAMKAFSVILDAFLNERHDQLALSLARGGKPLVPIASKDDSLIPSALAALKRISAKGGFEISKKLIKDLNPQATNHGEAVGEIFSDGTTVLRIPCLESEPVKTKHLPELDSTFSPTIDEDGQLNIYMIKQGNHWYWNPFGW